MLPGAAGGDGVRRYLTYKEGLKLRGAINGVILERVAAVVALVLLVGATLPFSLLPRLRDAGRDWVVSALMIVVVVVLGGIAILWPPRPASRGAQGLADRARARPFG